jgi:hypothetical protein
MANKALGIHSNLERFYKGDHRQITDLAFEMKS